MDDECDCPDPPPQFHLPSPPWPHFSNDFSYLNKMISETETCKTLSVMSNEYQLTTLIPILIIGAVIFFIIGVILVIIRRKQKQQLHSRKSSPTSYCESAIASSIIFEDMTDIHLRELTCLSSPCQFPSSEMSCISPCASQNTLFPMPTRSPSPVPKSYRSKDPFSQRITPVYQDFVDVCNEKRGTGSEGILSNYNSEDECTEDEASLEGGIENYPNTAGESRNAWLLEIDVAELLKNLNLPVGEDRSRFLEDCERYLNSASYREKEARICRGVRFSNSDTEKKLRRSNKKRERKDKCFSNSNSNSNSCSSRTDEGVFFKKLFHCYPSTPETDSLCSMPCSFNKLYLTKQCGRHLLSNGRHDHYSRQIIFTMLNATHEDEDLPHDSYL